MLTDFYMAALKHTSYGNFV